MNIMSSSGPTWIARCYFVLLYHRIWDVTVPWVLENRSVVKLEQSWNTHSYTPLINQLTSRHVRWDGSVNQTYHYGHRWYLQTEIKLQLKYHKYIQETWQYQSKEQYDKHTAYYRPSTGNKHRKLTIFMYSEAKRAPYNREPKYWYLSWNDSEIWDDE